MKEVQIINHVKWFFVFVCFILVVKASSMFLVLLFDWAGNARQKTFFVHEKICYSFNKNGLNVLIFLDKVKGGEDHLEQML